jgi:transcriptional regulator with XRE-family HTH domain
MPTMLQSIRIARTLTQADMATLLEVAQPTYSRWENGSHPTPLGMQARIAAILGVAVADLFPATVAAEK